MYGSKRSNSRYARKIFLERQRSSIPHQLAQKVYHNKYVDYKEDFLKPGPDASAEFVLVLSLESRSLQ